MAARADDVRRYCCDRSFFSGDDSYVLACWDCGAALCEFTFEGRHDFRDWVNARHSREAVTGRFDLHSVFCRECAERLAGKPIPDGHWRLHRARARDVLVSGALALQPSHC